MELFQLICENLPVADPRDLDFLLEYAELIRSALQEKRFHDAEALIRYTVSMGYDEAFYWALEILEESCAQGSAFECAIGRYIPEFDRFIDRLEVDLKAAENEVLPIRDENGEIQSFYNILTYKTGFPHIRLVTAENFDARDNDFIEYRLHCIA